MTKSFLSTPDWFPNDLFISWLSNQRSLCFKIEAADKQLKAIIQFIEDQASEWIVTVTISVKE